MTRSEESGEKDGRRNEGRKEGRNNNAHLEQKLRGAEWESRVTCEPLRYMIIFGYVRYRHAERLSICHAVGNEMTRDQITYRVNLHNGRFLSLT